MPVDAVLLSIAICTIFAVFAIVLVWADLTTSRWMRNRQEDAEPAVPSAQKAA